MAKTLQRVKNDLKAIFQTADCYDLVRFYDYVAGTSFHEKINEAANRNNYLDNKLRLAFEQIIERAKPSLLFDLHEFVVTGRGNTKQFFEHLDREKAEQLGKFGSAIKKLLKKIEDKGFEVEVDVQPGEGLLSLEIETTPGVTYMDFIDFIHDEFLNKDEKDEWMLIQKSGNAIALSYVPAVVISDVELDDPYDEDLEDETESMGAKQTYGSGVDPSKDNDLDESFSPGYSPQRESGFGNTSVNVPWDDSLNQSIPNYSKKYQIEITPFYADRDTAEVSGTVDSIKKFLKIELGYISSDFEMIGLK